VTDLVNQLFYNSLRVTCHPLLLFLESEAFQFIQEAVRLHLEDIIEDGESIPEIGIVDSIN